MKFKVFSQRALIGAGLLMVGITSAQSQIREESQGMILPRSLLILTTIICYDSSIRKQSIRSH